MQSNNEAEPDDQLQRRLAEPNRSTSTASSTSIRPATFHHGSSHSSKTSKKCPSKHRGARTPIARSNLPCSRFDDPELVAKGTSWVQTDWSYPRRRASRIETMRMKLNINNWW